MMQISPKIKIKNARFNKTWKIAMQLADSSKMGKPSHLAACAAKRESTREPPKPRPPRRRRSHASSSASVGRAARPCPLGAPLLGGVGGCLGCLCGVCSLASLLVAPS